MRHFAHALRLLPLLAAALASVATSSMTTFVEIDGASPRPDESAVDPGAVLTVRARVTSGKPPSGLSLHTRTHFDIAGHSERHEDADGELVYTFTPDAPLGPDDFVLAFDGDVEAGFVDPVLGALQSAYSVDGEYGTVARFTTVSRPAVLYITHPDAPVFIVYFSEAMDDDSLFAAVHVVDSEGVIVPAATVWHPDAHSYELQATPGLGAYLIRFDEGIVAASGVPLPGLPFTLAPTSP